jgi:hypothetical protein
MRGNGYHGGIMLKPNGLALFSTAQEVLNGRELGHWPSKKLSNYFCFAIFNASVINVATLGHS